MRMSVLGTVVLAAALLAFSGAASAAEKKDIGKMEYQSNCASCHGVQGKGDGVNKPYLTKSPTDLTTLAKQNGGVFPFARAYEVIDGRQEVKGHGSRDMPVWGYDYSVKAAEYYMDVPYDAETYVRARILALIEYINRLQVK